MFVFRKWLAPAIATVTSLATLLVGCSGGSAPATTPAPNVIAPVSSTGAGTSSSAASGQVTVSIALPHHSESLTTVAARRARIQALHGPKASDPSIRTMANTAVSRAVRAEGVRINAAARQYEKATGRSPAYVSPATYYVELTVYAGSTYVADDTGTCSNVSNECTASFTVPTGTGYTLSLYLYDSCDYLLSAGTVSNFAVTTGSNPVTITLNGVVAYLDVTSNASTPFIADPTQHQTFNVTVTPVDAEYFNTYPQTGNTVTTPGVLVNNGLVPITGVNLTTNSQASDVTTSAPMPLPTSVPSTTPGAYGFTPASYTYAGTGSESSVTWTATEVATGSAIVPTNESGPNGYYSTPYNPLGANTGDLTISVEAPTLSWTNPENYSGTGTSPLFSAQATVGTPTYASIEFPSLNESGTWTLGLSELISTYSGTITITDNGSCNNVVAYAPGSALYSVVSASPYVTLTGYNRMSPSTGCVLTATDSASPPRSAKLNVYYDQSNVTIEQKARAK